MFGRGKALLGAVLVASTVVSVGLVALPTNDVSGGVLGASPASAAPAGDPWVVSLGDSYISGEGGRWAGNTTGSSDLVDALGSTAYFDNPTDTAELIPGCHRSKSAEVHIGGGVNSKNLACSGAETVTKFESDGTVFKPGIDFFDDGTNHGQALMLQEFASTNRVEHVAVSIGGNNFNFASIVTDCVEDYAESNVFRSYYCSQDSTVTGYVGPDAVETNRAAIVTTLQNVEKAMTAAGYTAEEYTVSLQNYPAAIPYGKDFRYGESYERIYDGGCGFWNVDANWALNEALRTVNDTVFQAGAASGLTNLEYVDLSTLVSDRLLCENTVNLIPHGAISHWSDPGAIDAAEWINQVRTAATVFGPYELQESMHPNYWAQLALRNCFRQVYNNGHAKGGTCVRSGDGVDGNGEPAVTLEAGLLSIIPAASADAYTTSSGTPLTMPSPGVLANDTNPGDGELTSAVVAAPAHGTVTLWSDGSFTYVPTAGFVGEDSFTYRAATLSDTTSAVVVAITVQPTGVTTTPRFTG